MFFYKSASIIDNQAKMVTLNKILNSGRCGLQTNINKQI